MNLHQLKNQFFHRSLQVVNIKREGVDELIQYCKQKDIKIAVYTTHKTKRAIQYLQLA